MKNVLDKSRDIPFHLMPYERQDDHHKRKHQFIMEHPDRSHVDLVLLGDSITRRWEENQELEKKYMGKLKVINMGVGGDTINHLLWRINAGELDDLQPKYISLLIGTNSLPDFQDIQVVEGLQEVVRLIQLKCPEAILIYNHIFPRNPDKACKNYLSRIIAINQVMKDWLASNVIQLSMTDIFLKGQDSVDQSIMPDGLHINTTGYHLWGKELERILI